ncbi:hypothetical protein KIW84_074284 [Lathyrus oleraceus]|uniref:Uncharacterized protein n=1 Tax=Pisum sativum TaxID=3888 RepID=A0A9D4VSC4_PEA|nr:hypothetical protein KIW84_074284 [Pisum sativum]
MARPYEKICDINETKELWKVALMVHHKRPTKLSFSTLFTKIRKFYQIPIQKLLSEAIVLPLNEIIKIHEACHQCPKAARGDITPFLCETGHFTESEMFRYKIKIEVYHAGKCCKFVFWDKECSQFLGVSAIQKRDTMIEDGIDDPLEFPLALDVFLGLEIAFKVKWHPQ